MDLSPYSGFIADPARCSLLSVDAKRELVCELSKCPDSALKLLHEWTRCDIIQIFCSEFCKDRKYEGVSKQLILHYLFNAINGKSCGHGKHMKKSGSEPNSSNLQFPYKRQRKSDVPVPPVIASTPVTAGVSAPTNSEHLCENSACRASLIPADKFCRRCSCCICFKYDENKDPSLWLCCNSDQPLQEESCGSSCHLECAFSDERSGIMQNGLSKQLDGGYYCTHCGKQNDLLGFWKKQLLIAKDAWRLDVLCHRIFLSHKMLISTQKYLVPHEVVDTAMKRLEGELGPITGLPDKGREIVGRLAVGAEVQKLCTRAIETLESMLDGTLTADSQIQSSLMVPSDFIKLEDISHESVTVVFDLNASEEDYPSNLTGIIPMPARMLVVRGLAPRTSYVIKVVAFTSSKKIGSWEVRTNTIGCPKGLDPKYSMPVDVGKYPDNRITEENGSGLSNPSSESAESDKDSTYCADLNSLSESDVECYKSLDILYSVKAPHHCNETSNYSRDKKIDTSGVTKVDGPDKAPKVPAIETLESMLSGAVTADSQIQGSLMVPSDFIKIEDISHESVTVVFDLDVCPTLFRGVTGFNLWHRKVSEGDYHSNPTGIIPMPSRMLVLRGLAPCTSYIIKVAAFTGSKKIGSWVVGTNTIGCPKGLDAKDPMPVDVGKDPNNRSTKQKNSGLSNPSSAGAESDEDSTGYADRNSSSESDVERCKSLDILYSVKAPHHCNETTNYSRDRKIDVAGVSEGDGLDETPKVPALASDDNEEEPGLAAQAALLKRSTELMVCNQRALKQNLGMIGSEIAPHARTGNKSVASPGYHGSLLGIIQKETVNCKEVSGGSFEAKSGEHIPHDDSSKTEADPGCLSWKRTPGRIEDGHEDGPSEPNTSAQVSSLRKSSNLVHDKQGTLLENAPGSLVPRAGNGIKSGNRNIRTSSKSNNDDHVPQPGPLKPGTEPWSPSSNNPSGKADDIEQTDANAYVFCVKVIRWLECEGYVEANFRVKFLTWLSLRATRHEKKIVSVFVDTFIDDPASLAGQLRDTFLEAIYSKRPPLAP